MDRKKLLQIWIIFTLFWVIIITWWQWDNLTLKPWTLDWQFSFFGYGPAKTQARAAEIIAIPPLLLLAAWYVWFNWFAKPKKRTAKKRR